VILFKIADEHPSPFCMGFSPLTWNSILTLTVKRNCKATTNEERQIRRILFTFLRKVKKTISKPLRCRDSRIKVPQNKIVREGTSRFLCIESASPSRAGQLKGWSERNFIIICLIFFFYRSTIILNSLYNYRCSFLHQRLFLACSPREFLRATNVTTNVNNRGSRYFPWSSLATNQIDN